MLREKEDHNQVDDSLPNKQKKEGKVKQIKKKTQNVREITHYFSKVQKAPSINKNIPTPDKVVIQSMDRTFIQLQEEEKRLLQQIQEIKIKCERQKQQRQYFLTKSRNLICNQLKKISQINRFFNGQNDIKLSQKLNELTRMSASLKAKKERLSSNDSNAFQKYFTVKQIDRQEKNLSKLSLQISLLAESNRIQREQKSCYFAKEKWPTLTKRYQPLQLIGKGGFSEVYKAYDLYSNQIVAIKLSSVEHLLQNCGNKHEYLRHIKREYEIHKLLNHPNIVKLLQVIQLQSALCIVLEYCNGLTLSEYLKMEGTLKEEESQIIIMQIASVIFYLSSQVPAIIHYDLKPQNIIFSEGMVKVLDFGICKIIDSEHSKMALTSQGVGTFWYLPPQVFASNNPLVSNKVDVWSLGVIFYELIFGKRPFGLRIPQKSQDFSLMFDGAVDISQSCKQFISCCLQNEERRLSPAQIFAHPYLSTVVGKKAIC